MMSAILSYRLSAAALLGACAIFLAGCVENNVSRPPPVIKQESPRPAPTVPITSVLKPAPAQTAPASQPEKVTLTPPPGVVKEVRVGVLLPLSGRYASLGKLLLDAVQLALFEVAEENLVLLPRDTEGTPEGAQRAARAAIDAGAEFLIGPVFSGAVRAVAQLKQGQGLLSLAFSNNRDAATADSFLMGLLPRQRVERVVDHAIGRGLQRFAALLPAGPYGDYILSVYEESVLRHGGVLTRVERYAAAEQEVMSEAVKRLGDYDVRRKALLDQVKELEGLDDELSKRVLKRLEGLETLGDVEFDAVLLIESGRGLTALAPLLPYFEIDTRTVRILGIGDWGERSLVREPALTGAWYAAPSLGARAEFAKRYRAVFGNSPHALAPLAYDAGALSAVLSARKPDPAFNVDTLTDPRGFAGTTGLFRFGPDGLAEHAFSVIEIHPDGAREVSPAPEQFDAPVVN